MTPLTAEQINALVERQRQGAPPIVPSGGVLSHPGKQAQKDVAALRKDISTLDGIVAELLVTVFKLGEKVDILRQQVSTRQDKFQLGKRRTF